jgi:hypothetical protein
MQIHDEAEVAGAAQHRATQQKTEAGPDVSRAVADPANASPESLIKLQRLAGNASVSRMLTPSDEEQESQRSPVLDVVDSGGGSPLEADLRQEMEGRLGADFGDVRIHSGAKASESARSVQANAYTVGNDVVFRSDQWSPGSEGGKQTLAHELTHVVQQRSGPVAGTDTGSGIKVSSPGDEFEQAADRSAKEALAGPAPQTAAPAGPTAQRQPEGELEEEEQLQGSFVQRQPEGELEEEEELQGSFVQRQTEEEMLGEEEEETV